MKSKILLSIILSLLIVAPFSGCAAFGALRPAFSAAALTLLVELEALLREYESAAITPTISKTDIELKTASQDALYRDISDLLTLCHDQIPKSTLKNYRARLDAASARAR